MSNDDFGGFADLAATDDDLEKDTRNSTSKHSKTEKYPCTVCAGTGIYKGMRVHQEKSHCFSCKGKGYFLTSPEQRAKNKAKYEERKAKKEAEKKAAVAKKREVYKAEHRELVDFMVENSDWNNFFMSLIEQLIEKGELSEGQTNAAYNSMKKITASKEKKDNNRTVIDLTELNKVFDRASSNGLKKPVLRFEDIVVSLAPLHGNNAGFLYVKFEGGYAGKISPEGKFFKLRGVSDEADKQLKDFCVSPFEAAVKYGRETGQCACCGRELTNKDSIEAGIGPICAGNWF